MPVSSSQNLAKLLGPSRAVIGLLGLVLASGINGTPAETKFSPWPRHVIDASSQGADGVRLGDVDGDGRLDIVTGWEEGGVVRVCFNPGPAHCREPWPAVTVGTAPSVEDAVFVDLDQNGTLDVVSCLEGNARRVQIHWAPRLERNASPAQRRATLLNPGTWRTETFPATIGQGMWMFCVPLEMDGRHGVDLVIGSKGANGRISWLEAPANPRALAAWKLHRLRAAGWIMTLRAADLDHDGDRDILFSDRKGPRRGNGWLENPGPGATAAGLPWPEHLVGGKDTEVMFVDLVPRGRTWRLAAALKPNRLVVYDAPADVRRPWRVTSEVRLPDKFGTAKAVRLVALEPDAPPGLLFTCEHADGPRSGVGWFPVGSRGWGSARDIGGAPGVKYDLLELLDLDGDGDQDAITCEERDNLGVIWYENPAR